MTAWFEFGQSQLLYVSCSPVGYLLHYLHLPR